MNDIFNSSHGGLTWQPRSVYRLDRTPTSSVSFGRVIEWGSCSVGTSGFATREEATREAVRLAREMGWTPPKWWQFWRWNDTRISTEEANSTAANS